MNNIKISKNILLLLIMILWETIIIKSLMFKILPTKYFLDSLRIIDIMNGSVMTDKSYTFAANFFKNINIFGITTLEGWSYFLTPIFMLIILYEISKNKKYSLTNIAFIIMSVAFLNIYILGIGKDIIQFLFFLVIYIILRSKFNNRIKLIFIIWVLLFEAFNFRIYYAIMALLIGTFYFIYNYLITKKRKKIGGRKIVILLVVIFFIQIFLISLLSPSNYQSIIYARSSVNIARQSIVDVKTMINDIFGLNKNLIIFIGNYLINFIRILIPIELLFKGIKYIPFIGYQVYISYNLFKICKNIDNKNLLWIATILSYIMVAIIFEPDFGSFIRHESALFLILQYIILNSNAKGKKNEKN